MGKNARTFGQDMMRKEYAVGDAAKRREAPRSL